jgi:alpha-glucosidase (family GH31 glycosyl hydrolase)
MFNKDHPFEIDHGTGQQTYGYYPYYLNREKDNYFHLTYFRSSNAMDVIKEPVNGKTSLTFKVVGGVIDLRFFLGDINDPVETLQRMTSYAGYSSLPPFWALGFHQCRWGYENSSQLLEVLATY